MKVPDRNVPSVYMFVIGQTQKKMFLKNYAAFLQNRTYRVRNQSKFHWYPSYLLDLDLDLI